jgi:hypothetical protein
LIVFEITKTEDNPVYQTLEVENGNRQYDFLRSAVSAAIDLNRPHLSHVLLKALNFMAIACLHTSAGEYRPCPVVVGSFRPVDHFLVQAHMDDLINEVNFNWKETDPVFLASYVLWKINHIHPFINGNGRTARAACYFVLCVKAGGWLRGDVILPELLRRNRAAYVSRLQQVDASAKSGPPDLTPIHEFLTTLLEEQLRIGASPSA